MGVLKLVTCGENTHFLKVHISFENCAIALKQRIVLEEKIALARAQICKLSCNSTLGFASCDCSFVITCSCSQSCISWS